MQNSSPDESARILAHSHAAQSEWRKVPLRDRLALVRRFRHLLAERAEWLTEKIALSRPRPAAELITTELIPLAESCRFLERQAAKILRPRKLGGAGRPLWLNSVRTTISREPLGVVLILAPSNYPLFLAAVQTLQALAAGNAVLLKPAPRCSDVTFAFRQLLDDAGLPCDLVQVLPEGPAVAQSLMRGGVDKVVLTGSAETGSAILAELAPTLTPATMELSGCDAVVVRADADLDLVTRALVFGLRLNAGATCIAPRRVFVPPERLAELETKLSAALSSLEFIPVSDRVTAKAQGLIEEAVQFGAKLLPRGAGLPPAKPSTSAGAASAASLIGPIILSNVQPAAAILRDDLFAPILSLIPVRDDAEALHFTADSPYALGASIFSQDEAAARALADQIHAGIVTINDLIVPTADPRVPFGGRGRSGFGVTRGAEGLLEMTTPKVVAVRRSRFLPHFDAQKPGDAALFTAFLRVSHAGNWRTRWRALRDLVRAFKNRNRSPHSKVP